MANKKTKIIVGILGVLVAATAVAAVYFGGGTLFRGYTVGVIKDSGTEIPEECGPHNIKGLIPAAEPYAWYGFTDEMCVCDSSMNWIQNPAVPTQLVEGAAYPTSSIRLELENEPCACKAGYTKGYIGVAIGCVPDTSQQPEESEQQTPLCIFINPKVDYCSPNGQCIENSHLEQNRCQCDTGYEFNETLFVCERSESIMTLKTDVTKIGTFFIIENDTDAEDETDADEDTTADTVADTADEDAVEDADTSADTDAETDATDEESSLESCNNLINSLLEAFNEKEWTTYETVMKALEEENCFIDSCTPKFYWSVLYISLRDYLKAGLYYNDEGCTDCEWYSDLAGYASKDMSEADFDDAILRDLTKKTLEECPPPESYDEFLKMIIEAADLFSSKYFEADADGSNRGFAYNLIPVAYAQSTEFSDDVEDILKEEYEEAYGPDIAPECRSLEIVKPADLKEMEGKKLIDLPESGFIDEELAIVVDADKDAVYLYRYKSMEGTITFNDKGDVYDTEETSVYMNTVDTSKGDIVSVWALNEELQGLDACQDMLYVKIKSPAITTTTVTETIYVPASPVYVPPTSTVTETLKTTTTVSTTTSENLHAAAPEVPRNGPEVFFYFGGALAGGLVFKKRKKN
jgi:hypothetical protein